MADLRLRVIMEMADKLSAPLRRAGASGKDLGVQLQKLRQQERALNRFQKTQEALQGVTQKMGAASAAMTTLQAQTGLTGRAEQKRQTQIKSLQRTMGSLTDTQNRHNQSLQKQRDALNAAGINNTAAAQARLRTQIEQTSQAWEKQTSKLRKLKELNQQHSQNMMRMGMRAGVGAGLFASARMAGNVGARFFSEGVTFDNEMSRVQALTRLDKGDEMLARIRQQAKDLGDKTMFSATDAAQGQAFLAMAGFKPEAIMSAMPGLLDLAKAGNIDVGRGADISSNILSAYGIDPSEMGRVADVLTKTFTTANVDMEMLGETMKYAAPLARTVNEDLETISAMAGLMGNVGIQGSMAGTAMRNTMSRLSTLPKDARFALDELKVSTMDARGNLRPLIDIFADLSVAMEGLGTGKRLEYINDIFGARATPAAAALLESSKAPLGSMAGDAAKIRQYIDEVRNSAGAAAKTAQIMGDNMAGALDELSSARDTVRTNLFEINSTWMIPAVNKLTELTRKFGEWAQANPNLVKGATILYTTIVVLMGAFGALTTFLAITIGKFLLVRFLLARVGIRLGLVGKAGALLRTVVFGVARAFLWLGRLFLATPIGLAITFLSVAAYLFYTRWQDICGGFKLLMQDIAAVAMRIWGAIRGTAGAAADWVGAKWQATKDWLQGIWQSMGGSWSAVLQNMGATIVNFSPLGLFYQAFAGVLEWFGIELPAKFSEFGANILTGLVDGISSKMQAAREAVGNMADSVIGWFREKLGIHSPSRVFMELGGNIGQGAALGITGEHTRVQAAVLGLASAAAVAAPAWAQEPTMLTSPPALYASAPAGYGAGAPVTVNQYVTVNATPGMDAQAIARAVTAELERRERAQRGCVYSLLSDID